MNFSIKKYFEYISNYYTSIFYFILVCWLHRYRHVEWSDGLHGGNTSHSFPLLPEYSDFVTQLFSLHLDTIYMRAIQKVKNICAYSPHTYFVIAGHWFLVFSVMLKSCRTLSHGKCRDSCGHGCADWESRKLRDARCYSFSTGWLYLRLSCRRGKLLRGIILLYDNACPHTARQTQALLSEQLHLDIFENPPYSPDIAPSDFFPVSKKEGARCW